MAVMKPGVGLTIKSVQAAKHGADPDNVIALLVKNSYHVITQAVGILWIVLVVGKILHVHCSACLRQHQSFRTREHLPDPGKLTRWHPGQAVRITGLILVMDKCLHFRDE